MNATVDPAPGSSSAKLHSPPAGRSTPGARPGRARGHRARAGRRAAAVWRDRRCGAPARAAACGLGPADDAGDVIEMDPCFERALHQGVAQRPPDRLAAARHPYRSIEIALVGQRPDQELRLAPPRVGRPGRSGRGRRRASRRCRRDERPPRRRRRGAARPAASRRSRSSRGARRGVVTCPAYDSTSDAISTGGRTGEGPGERHLAQRCRRRLHPIDGQPARGGAQAARLAAHSAQSSRCFSTLAISASSQASSAQAPSSSDITACASIRPRTVTLPDTRGDWPPPVRRPAQASDEQLTIRCAVAMYQGRASPSLLRCIRSGGEQSLA